MKEPAGKREKLLTIRLTTEEFSRLEQLAAKSMACSLSDYSRSLILKEPAKLTFRNRSLDDFLARMSQLRTDMLRIGNDFNRSVQHLESLQSHVEIRQWLLLNEQDKARLFHLIETISETANAAYKLWSRK